MSEPSIAHNPFMLMLNPEIVIAAMEKSEKLAQLNRHHCRPLDRVTIQNPDGEAAATEETVEAADDEPAVDD
jgi:hypothetical protein